MNQQYTRVGESEDYCAYASGLKENVVTLASHCLVAGAVEVGDDPISPKCRYNEEETEVQMGAL